MRLFVFDFSIKYTNLSQDSFYPCWFCYLLLYLFSVVNGTVFWRLLPLFFLLGASLHLWSPVLAPLPSPALAYAHLWLPMLTCAHLPSPTLTCAHLCSPALPCPHLCSQALTCGSTEVLSCLSQDADNPEPNIYDGPTQQHNFTSLPLISHPDSTLEDKALFCISRLTDQNKQ